MVWQAGKGLPEGGERWLRGTQGLLPLFSLTESNIPASPLLSLGTKDSPPAAPPPSTSPCPSGWGPSCCGTAGKELGSSLFPHHPRHGRTMWPFSIVFLSVFTARDEGNEQDTGVPSRSSPLLLSIPILSLLHGGPAGRKNGLGGLIVRVLGHTRDPDTSQEKQG